MNPGALDSLSSVEAPECTAWNLDQDRTDKIAIKYWVGVHNRNTLEEHIFVCIIQILVERARELPNI